MRGCRNSIAAAMNNAEKEVFFRKLGLFADTLSDRITMCG